MPSPNFTRRHRLAVLAGAAVIAGPLALVPVLNANSADSGTNAATTTEQTTKLPDLSAPAPSFSPIVSLVKPAVVTVTTKMDQQNTASDGMTPFNPDSPMDEFFRRFFGENGPMPRGPQGRPPSRRSEALGSGFIIKKNGTVVTNNHVIDKASEITVTLDDGTDYTAKLIGRDAKTDLAVLKIDAGKDLPTVKWDDSDSIKLGDQVLAVGNPFGIGTTVTSGIVSARGRDLHNGPYDDFIQVDAAINHGNSGGPLVDMHGKVVGINSAIYSPNGGNVGVGFAIPSNQASAIVAKLMTDGSIERGFIGVQIQPVTEDVADAIGLSDDKGALVASVNDDSPAAKAGIETGDVITGFNDNEVDGPKDLARKVADVTPGDETSITVWRKNKSVDLPITVAEYDTDQVASASPTPGGENPEKGLDVPTLGLSLSGITPEARQKYEIPENDSGVVVDNIDPGKAAADNGLREGDVIVSVNQQTVTSASDATKAISKAKKDGRKSVLLLIKRDGNQTFVAVPFGKA